MYDGWNKSGLTQRSGGIRLKIYQALAELSYFYRQLYTKEIKKDIMEKLKKEISMLLCKLEKKSSMVVQSDVASFCSSFI
jgi:hypothetical protein